MPTPGFSPEVLEESLLTSRPRLDSTRNVPASVTTSSLPSTHIPSRLPMAEKSASSTKLRSSTLTSSLANMLKHKLNRQRQGSTASFASTSTSATSSTAETENFLEWYLDFLNDIREVTPANKKTTDDTLSYQILLGSNLDDVTSMLQHIHEATSIAAVPSITPLQSQQLQEQPVKEPLVAIKESTDGLNEESNVKKEEVTESEIKSASPSPTGYVSTKGILTELLTISGSTNSAHSPSSFSSITTNKMTMMVRTTLTSEEKLAYTSYLGTYRFHTSPHILLDSVIEMFLHPDSHRLVNARVIKANAAKMLMTWLGTAYCDFLLDPTLKEKFQKFLQQAKLMSNQRSPSAMDDFALRLVSAIESAQKTQLISEWRVANTRGFIHPIWPGSAPSALNSSIGTATALVAATSVTGEVDKRFLIMEEGHKQVAEALACIDRQIHTALKAVFPALVHLLVTPQTNFTIASLRGATFQPLRDWAIWTSLLCNWIRVSIIAGQKGVARVHVLKEFIKLARDLRALGDLYGCIVIIATLRLPWIACQEYMWRKLSKKHLALFRELLTLLDSNEQYSAYKREMERICNASILSTVPFLPIHVLSIVRVLSETPIMTDGYVDPDALKHLHDIQSSFGGNSEHTASTVTPRLSVSAIISVGTTSTTAESAASVVALDGATRRLQQHIFSIPIFSDAEAFQVDGGPSFETLVERISGEQTQRRTGGLKHGIEGSMSSIHAGVSSLLLRTSMSSRSRTWSNSQMIHKPALRNGGMNLGGEGEVKKKTTRRIVSQGDIIRGSEMPIEKF